MHMFLLDTVTILGTEMDETGMLILMVGVLAIAIAVLVGRVKANEYNKQDSGAYDTDRPLKTCKAKVVNKIDSANPNSMFAEYSHVVFDTEDGSRLKFAITDKSRYDNLVVGDEGELKHRGNAFVSFTRIVKVENKGE